MEQQMQTGRVDREMSENRKAGLIWWDNLSDDERKKLRIDYFPKYNFDSLLPNEIEIIYNAEKVL